MSGTMRVAMAAQTALLLLASPAAAQVRTGDLTSSLSGTIAPGYTAEFGNAASSSHSWTLGGAGTYTGSYHSPNFLSFNASVFVNQSRANSDFQSISNASGVNLTTNIFGGSRFPGSVTFSKTYNSDGNYDIPGIANYVTHGNSETFGINWGENIPNAPSVSAGFQMGSSKYSVYGDNDQGNNAFHSVNLHSSYKLDGFNMGAYYTDGDAHSLIPLVVSGEQSAESKSDNDAYGFNVTRRLPMQGSISAGINRSGWDSNYMGTGSNGTIDLVNAQATVHPASKLSLTTSLNYSDNLTGQLLQSVISSGGVVAGANTNQTSNSLDLLAVAGYAPLPNLQTTAFVEQRTQEFLGENYGVKSFGGSATYTHELLDGSFNASTTLTGNSDDKTGQDTLGFSTNGNYSSVVLGWHVHGSFGYAQNVQTLLVTYMNSFYNYSGNARRAWGKFNMSLGAGAARTALTEEPNTASSSESYSASFGYGAELTATGTYSKSSGQALSTGAGLVPVPVPPPTLPSGLITLFGGDSYSVGLSSTPVKGLVIGGSWAKSTSNTTSNSVLSSNENNQLNTLIQYQHRKLSFISGYARLQQGFSASGLPPEIISSYYFGVSRWFKFF